MTLFSDGPLFRLWLFGFLCPCHESDDEHVARMAISVIHKMPIQWIACDGSTLHATLTVVDTETLGPCLQLSCTDEKRHAVDTTVGNGMNSQEINGAFSALISLDHLEHISLKDDDTNNRIQLHGTSNSPGLLLEFQTDDDPVDLVELLTGIWHWDCMRRDDVEDARLRDEAAMRWREEQQRLVNDQQSLT